MYVDSSFQSFAQAHSVLLIFVQKQSQSNRDPSNRKLTYNNRMLKVSSKCSNTIKYRDSWCYCKQPEHISHYKPGLRFDYSNKCSANV